ncbi:MAG: hypothetical protein U0U67_15155 [Chitinophagales bacterium]
MEALIELTKIVNRKRLSKIDVLDKTFLNTDSTNLYYRLYKGIENGSIKNDDDAGRLLYGTDKADKRYRMLKSRYKSKLLKTLLLFNKDELFNYDQGIVYYQCITDYQAIEVLVKLTGTSNLVIELIKEYYNVCQKYKFYDLLVKYSFYLTQYHSLRGNVIKYYLEQKNFIEYIEKLNNEFQGRQIYNEVMLQFTSSQPINELFLNKLKENIQLLEVIIKNIDNDEIVYLYYHSKLLYEENAGSLDNISVLCDKIEDILKGNAYIYNNVKKLVVLLYRLKSFLHLRKYQEGLDLFTKDTSFFPPENGYNWFVLKEFEFKLYLHNNKIQEAYQVYESVLANKFFKRQVEELTEKWKIYHAYLVFMDSYINKGDYKFSLAKFLNDVPVNTRDKGGYNFAIRIVELLFQFARGEYNIIFQKMEGLRGYRTRYLNDNTYKRNHLFLSLLLKAEKEGFEGRAMKNASWKEIDELRKLNTYIIADWEIIPFDTIWDIFVDLAKK